MRAEDLRPGDQVVWNGHRVSITHTVGAKGQRHRWRVGVLFDGVGDSTPLTLLVDADHVFEVAF